jgi:membrane protein
MLKEVARAWSNDNIASMSAALAYYTVFSLAPLLLILITIAGFFFGTEQARQAISEQFIGLIGNNGAEAISAILRGANNSHEGAWSFVIGAVTLFIGATTVFAELQQDIDIIWKLPKSKAPSNGFVSLVKIRLLSFALIVSVGFLLIVSLVVSAAISTLTTLWGHWMINMEIALHIINFIVSTGIITVLFALIFKILPSTKIAWSDVWPGALVTALLFSIGKFAIGLYIGKSAIASTFGAAGAFVVLIVWIYYSAQIFLIGTEFTYVYACKHGSRRGQTVV